MSRNRWFLPILVPYSDIVCHKELSVSNENRWFCASTLNLSFWDVSENIDTWRYRWRPATWHFATDLSHLQPKSELWPHKLSYKYRCKNKTYAAQVSSEFYFMTKHALSIKLCHHNNWVHPWLMVKLLHLKFHPHQTSTRTDNETMNFVCAPINVLMECPIGKQAHINSQ